MREFWIMFGVQCLSYFLVSANMRAIVQANYLWTGITDVLYADPRALGIHLRRRGRNLCRHLVDQDSVWSMILYLNRLMVNIPLRYPFQRMPDGAVYCVRTGCNITACRRWECVDCPMRTIISINNIDLDDTTELDKEFANATEKDPNQATQEDSPNAGSPGSDAPQA